MLSKKTLTIQEFLSFLKKRGIKKKHAQITYLCYSNKLPCKKIGRMWFIFVNDVNLKSKDFS